MAYLKPRPTSRPDWGGTQTEPPREIPGDPDANVEGWVEGQRVSAYWLNWVYGFSDQWIDYLDGWLVNTYVIAKTRNP